MKNKVLVELIVPEADETFNVYLPINRRIGNIIALLNKSLFEYTNGAFIGNENTLLYDVQKGETYEINKLLRETDIRQGSKVILM